MCKPQQLQSSPTFPNRKSHIPAYLLSYVYLGWRTTGGTWQNQVIEDFFSAQMEEAGYTLANQDLSWDDEAGDFFYIQHDDTSSLVFNPEYAHFKIDSIENEQGDTVDESDDPFLETAHRVLDQELFAFDPTSDVYQAHYTELYGTELEGYGWDPDGAYSTEQEKDDAFINAMWQWITEKDGQGNREHVFPEGTEVGAPRGEEAEMNRRAHLAGSTSFNVSAEDKAKVEADIAELDNIGTVGKVVYVGSIDKNGNSSIAAINALLESDPEALKGAVLLCDSSHRNNMVFAEKVGAISTMTYASLEYYHHPTMTGETWYGADDAQWYEEIAQRADQGEETFGADVDEWYSDSGRYTLNGAGAATATRLMEAGTPVVEWNISKQQYVMLRELIETKGYTVNMNIASMGEFYAMNDQDNPEAKGQLTAIAEIKGSTYPDERVVIAGHVQEPSSNDNATGCSLTVELAVAMKEMIDEGILPRPERTMTFLIGDEMQFSSLYLNAHDGAEGHPNAGEENLVDKIVCSIDLDMTGEDCNKTGGSMRIEKCPDPSAYYNYMLDTIPEDDRYLDENGGHDGEFVRTPDSHTLWGAGSPSRYDIGGNYLNDLYMSAAGITADLMQEQDGYDFRVDVCPFEGGSDHGRFLQRGVPAVLTWHFTDYVYHTTVDTLYMSSAKELQSVGLTSLGTAYMMAHKSESATTNTMGILVDAAQARFDIEANNTTRHKAWADAESKNLNEELDQEKEVLNAWADWYVEAIESCAKYLTDDFAGYDAAEAAAIKAIEDMRADALAHANETFGATGPVVTGDYTLTLADGSEELYLDLSDQDFTVTLTVPVTDATRSRTVSDWTVWANSLDWYLTRDEDDTYMNRDLYPNIYTGDQLDNWMTWGKKGNGNNVDTSAATKYFDMSTPATATQDGDVVTVTKTFSHGTFFGDGTTPGTGNSLQAIGSTAFRYTRYVFGSFIGDYKLSVKEDSEELASTDMFINTFESYYRYEDLKDELDDIVAAAAENGRYFKVESYGKTVDGNDQWVVIASDSAASVTATETRTQTALTNPASLQAQLDNNTLTDYRIPVMLNNVHPDEGPAPDAIVNFLWTLATADTIPWNTITGLKSGQQVDKTQYDPKVAAMETEDGKYAFTGYGLKISGDKSNSNGNTGVNDASEFYTFSGDKELNVDELLRNILVIASPVENPDGRTYNTRPNANAFDLNRDCSNQTQPETTNMAKLISKWNPVAFIEFHGYTAQFLVEPCTPPHEPNLEYDVLVKNFLLSAEAFGNAALATLSTQHADEFELKVQTYYTPLRDDYDPQGGWSAWDDLNTNYTPSYAMLNCGAMGLTIETPAGGEAACSLLEGGLYGIFQYFMDEKDDIYHNQLEFFRRGIENEDHRADMEEWYVDMSNQPLASDTWRVPGANDNYFPEYWVIPVDRSIQRDPAAAWDMAEFLTRNGVKVSQLTENVGDYKAGDLVVDMYQAKRNYANAVLWEGCDASASGFPRLYSEYVSNFPAMRGFDAVKVEVKDAFAGKLAPVSLSSEASQFSGAANAAVIISNNGVEAVKAVNSLLDAGKAVGLITEGANKGDFVTSYGDYSTVSSLFTLVATGTTTMPAAHEIEKPNVFLTGRYAATGSNPITTGYYAEWFSDGVGFANYQNIHNNGTSAYDVMAYDKQMGFTIVEDPAQADVIVGSVALNSGAYGTQAAAAVRAGTPYIATGNSSLSYIKNNLVPGLTSSSLGQDSLHYVEYPTDSLSTAPYAAAEDNVIYTYGCAALANVPAEADILIKAIDTDSHITGCCLTQDGKAMDGRVEAFALEKDGMDLTVFANSVVNRAHQQDDYRFVTTTIYSKVLKNELMEIAGTGGSVTPTPTPTPTNRPGSGGGSGSGGGTRPSPSPAPSSKPSENTTTVKNPDGSTTVTVTDNTTGEVTATTTYPDGTKAETVTTSSGRVTATVTVPEGKDTASVTLPVAAPGSSTVVKVVNPDGTETILPWAVPTSGGMAVTVSGTGDVKLTVTENAKTFNDVANVPWARDAVAFVTSRELFQGTGSGAFSPSASMSRAMLVTVLHRLEGTPAGGAISFPDVTGSTWYTDAVAWASSNNIVNGTGNGFDPDGEITRETLAVMLYRYAQFRNMDLSQKAEGFAGFTDGGSVSTWAEEAMRWAVGSGIITGKDGNRLDPTGTATRAEVSIMLMRFLSL